MIQNEEMTEESHHYVPIFYLKNFAIQKKSNFYLNCYNKKDDRIFCRNIKNIACEKNFYGTKDIIECNAANAIKKIIRNESLGILSDSEKKDISNFASLLMVRTEHHRMMLDQMLNGVMHRITPQLQPSDNISNYDFKYTSDGFIEFINNSIQTLSKIIVGMKWFLIINNTDIPFWTSDNPLCLENELKPKPGFSNMGLACRCIQVHLPLNSNISLHFLHPMEFSTLPDIMDLFDEQGSIHENFLQVYNSKRCVYSESNNFLLARQVLYVHPELKDGSGISMVVK